MTPDHLVSLMPRLRERDVHELHGIIRESSLGEWAARRSVAVGIAWTLLVGGVPMLCGGVLEGATRGIGAIWMVGAQGCERYIKHVLRVWKFVLSHGGFRRIECKCYADNEPANRFAVRAGFLFEGTLRAFTVRGEDINQYGMVCHGR